MAQRNAKVYENMSGPPHVLTMADNVSRGAAAGCDVKPPGRANIYCCCCLKSATVAADKTGVINRGANYKDWAVEFWAEDPCWFIFLLCCACKLGPRGRESFPHSSLFILSGRYCRSGARGKDVKCRDRSGFAADLRKLSIGRL